LNQQKKTQEFNRGRLGKREYLREESRDPWFFSSVLLAETWPHRFQDLGDAHHRMFDFLNPKVNPKQYKYFSAYRGSLKTTILEGLFENIFCEHIEERIPTSIMYLTAIKENAFIMSGRVRWTLANSEIINHVYQRIPHEPGKYDEWTKQAIEYQHVRFEFASLETTLVWRHHPIWGNDDLENDQNTKSDYQRKDLKERWKYQKAILTKSKIPGESFQIDTGTPYHFQGLNWYIRSLPSYDKFELPCWRDIDGRKIVTIPELHDKEYFLEKREQMGKKIFANQYELICIAEEDQMVNPDWFRRWRILPEYRWRTMVIDPGGAEPGKSDATGITICDFSESGILYVAFADEFFITPLKLIDLILDLKLRFNPDDIRIEKERYSTTIADTLRHRFPQHHISFVEHKGRRKEGRIWKLRQWFESGRILIGENMPKLEEQLMQYQGKESIPRDDIIDSLSYHLDILRKPSPRYSGRLVPTEPGFERELERRFNLLKEKTDVSEYDSLY
jgi:hypothetical protein